MTFHAYLTEQADRDDMIGDLARDYMQAVGSGRHGIAETPRELWQIIPTTSVGSRALDVAAYEFYRCPACEESAAYSIEDDRFYHRDGTDNRDCWVAILRGEVAA